MKFEEFQDFVSNGVDISRFEKNYFVMLDVHGAVPRETVGFNFSVNDEESIAEAKDLFETFSPIVIWCGNQQVIEKVSSLGYQGKLFPWFQNGGYAVVLKIPIRPKCCMEKQPKERLTA